MLLHRIEFHQPLLRNVPLLFAVIVKNNLTPRYEGVKLSLQISLIYGHRSSISTALAGWEKEKEY